MNIDLNIISYMKKYIFYTAVACATFAFVSCQGTSDGKQTSENIDSERKVIIKQERPYSGNFEQITILGSTDVVYRQDEHYSIVVECDSIYAPLVVTSVESGTLTINLKGEDQEDVKLFAESPEVTVYVTSPVMRIVSVCGSGSFKAEGPISANDFHTGVIGSGDMSFDSLMCKKFKYQSTGSGDAEFGYIKASSIDLLSNGSGDLKVGGLMSDSTVTIGMTSSGDMEIESAKAENVNIVATSSGNGLFSFDCMNLEMAASGSGHHILEGRSKHGSVRSYGSAKVENNLERK